MAFEQTQQTAYLDKVVTIRNITDNMFTAKWGGDTYVVNPQSEEQVPMWLGRHLMRHAVVDGKSVLELIENVKVTCGVCQKEFDDKRQLGAHSLTHRQKTTNKE